MTEIMVSVIPTEHVLNVWPQVVGYIEDALVYTYGRYEAEDILEQLIDGNQLLWIAFEGSKIKGVVVTRFIYYPRKKYLGCPIVSGDEFDTWKLPMLDTLQMWASDNGCEGLEATARLGWARKFKSDGYEALWQTFQLPAGAGSGVAHG